MGYIREIMTINARISNHNSEQDETDRATWERFAREVRELAAKPEYEGLELDISGGDPW